MKNIRSKVPLLRDAKDPTAAYILDHAAIRKYKRGEHIFIEQEQVDYIYIIIKGTASLYRLVHNHEKRIIFIHQDGDILNEVILDGLKASINCELLSDAKVLAINKERFLDACEKDFAFMKMVLSVTTLRTRRLYRQIKNTVNSLRGDKKIAAKLWKLAKDYGEKEGNETKITIPFSITSLSEAIGSRRETVSRQVKILADLGLIIIDKKFIIIPDRDALLKYAKEP